MGKFNFAESRLRAIRAAADAAAREVTAGKWDLDEEDIENEVSRFVRPKPVSEGRRLVTAPLAPAGPRARPRPAVLPPVRNPLRDPIPAPAAKPAEGEGLDFVQVGGDAGELKSREEKRNQHVSAVRAWFAANLKGGQMTDGVLPPGELVSTNVITDDFGAKLPPGVRPETYLDVFRRAGLNAMSAAGLSRDEADRQMSMVLRAVAKDVAVPEEKTVFDPKRLLREQKFERKEHTQKLRGLLGRELAEGPSEHTRDFANMMLSRMQADPRVNAELGQIDWKDPNAKAPELLLKSLYSTFGRSQNVGKPNDIEKYWVMPENWRFLPDDLRTECDRIKSEMDAGGEPETIVAPEAKQAVLGVLHANAERLRSRVRAASKAMSAPYLSGPERAAAQTEAERLDPDLAAKLKDKSFSDAMFESMFRRAVAQMNYFRQRSALWQQTSDKRRNRTVSLNEEAGEGKQLGDYLEDKGGAEGAKADDPKFAPGIAVQRQMRRLQDTLVTELPRFSKQVGDLSRDILRYMSRLPVPTTGADGKPLPPDRKRALAQERYVDYKRLELYAKALNGALAQMADPESPEGRAAMDKFVQRVALRLEGKKLREKPQHDFLARGVPDVLPAGPPKDDGRPSPLAERAEELEPKVDPRFRDLYRQFTRWSPSDTAYPHTSSLMRQDLNQTIVGLPEFQKTVRDEVDRLAKILKDTNPKYKAVSSFLDQPGKESFAVYNMKNDFRVWGKLLLTDAVQQKYDPGVRRLIVDMLPTRSEFESGAGANHSNLAVLYHAARGELQRMPSEFGYSGRRGKAAPGAAEAPADARKPFKVLGPGGREMTIKGPVDLNDALTLLDRWKSEAEKNVSKTHAGRLAGDLRRASASLAMLSKTASANAGLARFAAAAVERARAALYVECERFFAALHSA